MLYASLMGLNTAAFSAIGLIRRGLQEARIPTTKTPSPPRTALADALAFLGVFVSWWCSFLFERESV
jgi:hypothetical protein